MWGLVIASPWWRHQMETFSTLLAICAGNHRSPVNSPTVTRSFDAFLDLLLNKRLSKQWWGRKFETPSNPLWRYCNAYHNMTVWHFGPCVTFWPCLCEISARFVWHFGPLVRNEGKRVSPYPHINHWRRLQEIPPIIGIKNNLTTIQQFHRVIADSCYCVRIILTAFKHFDMKGSRYRVTSTASLDDGIVRQQFPVAKGCHVT